MRKNVILVALVAVAILASALFINAKPAAAQDNLYTRLGGNAAITAVVGQFLANVGADARINKFFASTDLARLQTLLIEQIGQATGGPEKYTGRDMKTTHKGMGITDADFGALVEDLVAALDKFNVPATEKNELLTALAGMKGDIVEVPAVPTTGGAFDTTNMLALIAVFGAGLLGLSLVLRKRATEGK